MLRRLPRGCDVVRQGPPGYPWSSNSNHRQRPQNVPNAAGKYHQYHHNALGHHRLVHLSICPRDFADEWTLNMSRFFLWIYPSSGKHRSQNVSSSTPASTWNLANLAARYVATLVVFCLVLIVSVGGSYNDSQQPSSHVDHRLVGHFS